jgi:hypothetical protein
LEAGPSGAKGWAWVGWAPSGQDPKSAAGLGTGGAKLS